MRLGLRRPFLRPRHPVLVEVFTRVGCGLCRQAERLVAEEARRAEIRYVDVDADPELQCRYHVRVPVVAVNGHEIAEAHLAPGSVRRAVRRARLGRSWPQAELPNHTRTRASGRASKEGT